MKLSRTIKDTNGSDTDEVILREPTVEDQDRVGFPFTFDKDGNTTVNAKLITNYISRLGNLPMSSVNKISLPDWNKLMGEILDFFADAPKT